MDNLAESLTAHLLHYGPKVAVSAVVFLAFLVASSIASRFIVRIGKGASLDEHVVNLFRQITRTTLIILGAVTALGTAGVNVSGLVAGLGLMGFALGFALKDALSNLLSGVLILVYQPFKPGETIEVAGLTGKVTNIDLRYTTLKGDGKEYLVPNSTLFTKPITINADKRNKLP